MWVELDGQEELEHEGIKCYIVLVNIDTGVQVVKRVREQATEIEERVTKNIYQLILRNLNGKWQVLKTVESRSELSRELNKLKEIIKEE